MADGKFIAWGFTLNNYSEQELCMIRQFPDFIRECIWELEEGEDSKTPHVQGFLRLKTQQRISFLLKHFLSRAHYTGLTSEEFKQNMKKYVQKQDSTATSAVVQSRDVQPILFPAVLPEMIVQEMIDLGYQLYLGELRTAEGNVSSFDKAYELVSRRLVTRYRVETIVSRPDIRTSTRLFLAEIFQRLEHNRTDADDNSST